MASAQDAGEQAEPVVDAPAGADDENAALVAELEAEQGKKPPAKVAKPAAADKKAPAKDEPTEESPEDPDDEPDEVDADAEAAAPAEDEEDDLDEDDEVDPDEDKPDDEDSDEELDAESAKDPELVKRHAALRRTATRQRQRLEQERAGFERERSTWQTETKQVRESLARVQTLVARAKIDPAAVLEALGLSLEDMEYAGQQCYARGKTAAADPKYRQAAERAARERELGETAAANAKRIADLEAKLESKELQAAADREVDALFERTFRKVTDATPITARLITKRPKAARAELERTAVELGAKLGRLPKVGELIAAHEKREVRALKLRGIKPPTPGTGKPAPAVAGKLAVKPAIAKPAPAADPESDDVVIPTTADLVKELQAAQRN
jgi:hypothetical protein